MATITWTPVAEYSDILYEHSGTGIARVTINRPRPQRLQAEDGHRDDRRLRGMPRGPVDRRRHPHRRRRRGLLLRRRPEGARRPGVVDEDGVPRLNVLDLQSQIRALPKPVIAMVAGYAIGGGHVLHVVCDLTIAADNAIFGQTGPRVGSFDGGFGVELPRADRRPEEGARDLVPVPAVHRAAGAGDGPRQRGRAAGANSRPRACDGRARCWPIARWRCAA